MEAVVSFLLENYPWIAAIVIVAAITSVVSIYVHKVEITRKAVKKLPCEDRRRNIEVAERKFEKLEEVSQKVENLPCEEYRNNIIKSDARFKNIEDTMTSNNSMLVEINRWIMKIDNGMIDRLSQKASPLKMTSIGEILFNQSHAKKAVDDNLDFLLSELDAYNPKTAFDVEDKAWSVLFRNIGHDMFTDIKNYIYYAPETIKITDPDSQEETEVKLSIQSIIRLMGIYLRDQYLVRHSDIK